jgi:hypothetical protein
MWRISATVRVHTVIARFVSPVVETHILSSGSVARAVTARSWPAGSTRAVQVLLTDQPDTSAASSQRNDTRPEPSSRLS